MPSSAKCPDLRGLGGFCLFDWASQVAIVSPDSGTLLELPSSTEPLSIPIVRLPAALRELGEMCSNKRQIQANRNLRLGLPSGAELICEAEAFPCGTQTLITFRSRGNSVEQSLARLERLASMGTLSAIMAHEIKNALVASKTFVELLLEKQPGSELGEVVRRELNRIDEISSRVLRYANPKHSAKTDFHLHACVDYLLRLLQPRIRSQNVELKTDFGAEHDLLGGSEPDLQQAFLNLLLNGLEAMGHGGTLTVATHNMADRLRLVIQDTGPGISQEVYPRLFQPFFTTKAHGTGLGLAIAHRIVAEHEGTLTLENPAESGARFVIDLPLNGK
jgi:signal transduction histidine kinase